jgi:integrase
VAVNELLNRWLDVLDVERRTRASYVSRTEEHVRLAVGQLEVGR